MYLRRENDELQVLKAQVQEMAEEINLLKNELKHSKESQINIVNDSGRVLGKTVGRSMVKQHSLDEAFNNKHMFNQLVKAVSFELNSRSNRVSSFGEN